MFTRSIRNSLLMAGVLLAPVAAQAAPGPRAIDAEVRKIMAATKANGLAVAVIEHGKVRYVQAYGIRNANGDPLLPDTIMAGASITKAVFSYTVMQLVDQGKLDLDRPLADDLDKPLPDYDTDAIAPKTYGPYKDLAGDSRWQVITPRMVLTHSTGFANFWWLEPDGKLRIHFDPGTRFSYSGEGFVLLQFVIEHGKASQGLGLDVGDLAQSTFARLGMTRTSLKWRPDFASNVADGWNDKGDVQGHKERSRVGAAGSMDTTISDYARFTAALVRGDGLSARSHAEMIKPQLKITSAHMFPAFGPDLPVAQQRPDLYAGLGLIVFDGPQGRGFEKGGHEDTTANDMVCLERRQNCVVFFSNDVRAEAGYAELAKFILGDTGAPYEWLNGDHAGKS